MSSLCQSGREYQPRPAAMLFSSPIWRRTPAYRSIDVSALFGAPSAARDRTDQAIMDAAATSGFFVAQGFPPNIPVDRDTLRDLLRLFQLPPSEIRRLWRQKFDPSHSNVYRGWFPPQKGFLTSKEGIDLGPDVAYGPSVVRDDDPLREATPLPSPDAPARLARGGRELLSRHGACQSDAHAFHCPRLGIARSNSSITRSRGVCRRCA